MDSARNQVRKIIIREIEESDIESVLAIDRRITGDDRAGTYTVVPNSYVGGELDVSVVAEVGGETVGFLLGRVIGPTHAPADTAWLDLIGVDPDFRHQDIGTKLVEAFTERCRQRGMQSVHIIVSWHDWWLLSFIRSLGFARGEMAEFVKPIES